MAHSEDSYSRNQRMRALISSFQTGSSLRSTLNHVEPEEDDGRLDYQFVTQDQIGMAVSLLSALDKKLEHKSDSKEAIGMAREIQIAGVKLALDIAGFDSFEERVAYIKEMKAKAK